MIEPLLSIRKFASEKHRTLIGILACIWITALGLQLHGFSISRWHGEIDNAPAKEILWGEAQSIRSDDWLVTLPTILSQRENQPPFSIQNSLFGFPGHNTLVIPGPIPVKHYITVFRPHAWGYFFGPNIGFAWHWWFFTLGIFYAGFLTMYVLNEKKAFGVSVCTGLILLYSPFLQFWSLNSAPMVIFSLLTLVSAISLAEASTRLKSILSGLFLFWTSSCFVFGIFPPFQITLGYLALFLFMGYCIQYKSRIIRNLSAGKIGIALASALLTIISIYIYFQSVREPLNLLMNTAYPGQRVSPGAEASWSEYFNNNFLTFLNPKNERLFGNFCEGGSFYLFFPLAIAATAISTYRSRKFNAILGSMILYLGFILLWGTTRLFPEFFAKITLLSLVPGGRTIIGVGIASTLLVSLSLAGSEVAFVRRDKTLLSIFWLAIIAVLAYRLRLKGARPNLVLIGSLFSIAMGELLIIRRWKHALPLLAILSLILSFSFNPIVRGGADLFFENTLSKKILAIESQAQKPALWVTYQNSSIGNLLRAIGVHALSGVHYYPQFSLWKILDPTGQYTSVYNRYAHVSFETNFDTTEASNNITFSNPQNDMLIVHMHPDHPKLAELGVDHLLFAGSDLDLNQFQQHTKTFRLLFSVGRNHVFEKLQ